MINSKDFVSMKDLSADEILDILNTAETMKMVLNNNTKRAPYLNGKAVVMYFTDKQSRTKLSFELAAQYLSASVADLSGSSNRYDEESVASMGKIIENMGADFIVLRHHKAGAAKYLAENVSARVINVGDGNNESPTNALLDLLTIKNIKGGFEGLNVTFVGDITNNRQTKSSIIALTKLGAYVRVYGPSTLINPAFSRLGVKICTSAVEACINTDVIINSRLNDVLDYKKIIPSLNEYKNMFKIGTEMLNYANKDCIVMSSSRIKRGIEVSSKVLDSNFNVVNDQISNAVASNMALFYLLSLNGGNLDE